MSDEILYCIRLDDPSGEFEPAGELLNALEFQFDSYFDRENFQVRHTVYAQSREEAEENLKKIRQNLPLWKELEVELIPGEIFELPKAQWAEAWKKYFRPVEVSDRLLIRPSWIDDPAKPGQTVLTIDPGLSFGTGQHATTLFCLKQIDRFAGKKQSLLDAGCGSGILAIAGALRGYSVVDAFDFDPDAVRIAEENVALNQVGSIVKPQIGDAADYPGRPEKYDLVCANILGHLLIAFRFNIVKWVAPGGHLALAGILNRDFDKVSSAFCEIGWQELERSTQGEWTGGLFCRKEEIQR